MHDELPSTDTELDGFLAAFEAGTLPKARWTHAAHLLTGACYVHALGPDAALARMRERVSAYNVAVGGQNTATGGYHETVTAFWIKLIAGFHARSGGLSRLEFARSAVEHFAPQRAIYAEFYDFDVVASEEARRAWVAPTRKAL